MPDYKKIKFCRLCKKSDFINILSLGNIALTGVFPKKKEEKVPSGPLDLIQCKSCKLVQLEQTYNLNEMYGDNYGYRSGLNMSMVNHLKSNIDYIQRFVDLNQKDICLDIGSNDGTTLNFLINKDLNLIGIDPSAGKFQSYYDKSINLIIDFFSAINFRKIHKNKNAKLVTSFSMFYDLEDPLDFAKNIFSILDDDGVWFLEQSYLPSMIQTNSFDTICQEHLEYYAFEQIEWIAERTGFIIYDVRKNNVNGGSFQVVLGKKINSNLIQSENISNLKKEEKNFFLKNPFELFKKNIEKNKNALINLLTKLKNENKKIYGLGASTKGNVLLQYYKIDESLIPFIAEVNQSKYNCFTPKSLIPIISENEILKLKPDYLLVLPWHFKDFFVSCGKYKDIKLIFPLPIVMIN